MTIFYDNSLANSATRQKNVSTLIAAGFIRGGLKSCSGKLVIVEKKTKVSLIFGERSNISGKGANKYFSLSKDFATAEEAKAYAKSLELEQKK